MNNLQVFSFENVEIRTIVLEDGEIVFVAKDVASTLGYENTAQAVRTHCRKAKSLIELGCCSLAPTLDPQIKMIPESDIYRLTMKSTLKTAERFQDWVTEEVLPSIRKTGQYSIQQFSSPEDLMVGQAKLMLQVCETLASVQKRITTLEDRVNEALPQDGTWTILAFFQKQGIKATLEERQFFAKEAVKRCKQQNILIDRVPDKRYGFVNVYPESVLLELLEEFSE